MTDGSGHLWGRTVEKFLLSTGCRFLIVHAQLRLFGRRSGKAALDHELENQAGGTK
jgi:hypothetical protein